MENIEDVKKLIDLLENVSKSNSDFIKYLIGCIIVAIPTLYFLLRLFLKHVVKSIIDGMIKDTIEPQIELIHKTIKQNDVSSTRTDEHINQLIGIRKEENKMKEKRDEARHQEIMNLYRLQSKQIEDLQKKTELIGGLRKDLNSVKLGVEKVEKRMDKFEQNGKTIKATGS